ncbi:universal stress protein [Haloarcula nitratireducens]|uniref:Universal stress protein n=1 Tax=Haloarcula nitratireducens TaxID=2487749 RepID=A0AAW4PHM3_9EURY|nr:universal stress protein [Halomicroarcula nitratireducens]MBX0296765.1 universal stress protein [Halomicroarcula nitratireducens]
MYHDILIPTDGSDASVTALNHGMEIASSMDATVHLLHVVDVGVEMSAAAVGDIADDLTEALDEDAKEALNQAEQMADEAGVTSKRAILEGVPEDAIHQYSADNGIDLIVVGESEESTITEQFFGSTTDDVLESATVSVLVARD